MTLGKAKWLRIHELKKTEQKHIYKYFAGTDE